jgi:hypothetical protein
MGKNLSAAAVWGDNYTNEAGVTDENVAMVYYNGAVITYSKLKDGGPAKSTAFVTCTHD